VFSFLQDWKWRHELRNFDICFMHFYEKDVIKSTGHIIVIINLKFCLQQGTEELHTSVTGIAGYGSPAV
jgi:hypothetical protein